MIEYVVIPGTKTTIAILRNTAYDCVNKINQMLEYDGMKLYNEKKYLMPNEFIATVKCDPRDKYTVEEGKRQAKKKLMEHYYKSLNKRLDKFSDAITHMNHMGEINKILSKMKGLDKCKKTCYNNNTK